MCIIIDYSNISKILTLMCITQSEFYKTHIRRGYIDTVLSHKSPAMTTLYLLTKKS